jgi:hypothetical protein
MVHDTDGVPSNHFEADHYWSAQPGRRLIALTGDSTPPSIPGVKWIAPTATSQMKSHMMSQVTISHNRQRQLNIYRGIE